jgi:class 3 adenylate cyclase
MGLKEDLISETKSIFATDWKTRDGRVVPEPGDVKLGNDAVTFEEAVVLYADLAESTELVNKFRDWFAAEVYKSYLHCASKIIRSEGGEITAFDGDRVMAVFLGDRKRTSAARCALRIKWAVNDVINPAIKSQFPTTDYTVRHAVGADMSKLFVARTGIRGANDLVWVGRSANYAAKLCSLRESYYASFITASVYDDMNDEAKYAGKDRQNMWDKWYWTERGIYVYRSSWQWGI